MGVHETKTFKSGNSVAVRLPKELGFAPGTPVRIERNGDGLTIRPAHDEHKERQHVTDLLDALAAIRQPVDGVQPRPDFLAPERPGL